MEIMQADGIQLETIRAGNDNLFQASVFSTTLAALSGKPIERYQVTGAVGAARACMVPDTGLEEVRRKTARRDYLDTILPPPENKALPEGYQLWKHELKNHLNR